MMNESSYNEYAKLNDRIRPRDSRRRGPEQMTRDEAIIQLRTLLEEGKRSLHDGSKIYTMEEVRAHFGV